MTKLAIVLVLAAALAGCSLADAYDKEYVLYDSTPAAAKGSPGRAAKDAEAAVDDARQGDPEGAATAPAAGAPGELGADADLARIFILENLLDELDRALRQGVGDAARLQDKRTQIDAEITWRKAEAGALYERERGVRVERLSRFPVVLK